LVQKSAAFTLRLPESTDKKPKQKHHKERTDQERIAVAHDTKYTTILMTQSAANKPRSGMKRASKALATRSIIRDIALSFRCKSTIALDM
jgi:hypothetical protein